MRHRTAVATPEGEVRGLKKALAEVRKPFWRCLRGEQCIEFVSSW
jgi:hypothetical protein